jgi:hypothetical protein
MYESTTQLYRQAVKMVDNIFEPYLQASALLQDENLVWADDFDSIRKPLALSLKECATTKNLNPWLLEVAYRLIDTTRADA